MADDPEEPVDADAEDREEEFAPATLSGLREPWERLRWARRQSKFATARAAALSVGMNEATYSAYERRPDSSKHIPLSHPYAVRFGRAFKVRWEWLLTGEGPPRASALAAADAEATELSLRIVKLPKEDRDHIVSLVERLGRRSR